MHIRVSEFLAYLRLLMLLSMQIFTSNSSNLFESSRIERRNLKQAVFQVEENTEPGQIIGSIYDKISLPLDRRFQFSLPQNPFFKFDSEGSLVVAGKIDRDDNPALCKEPGYPETCEWTSFLVDNKGNYISLRVYIEDVNDNTPSWPTSIVTITIPENSAPNFTTELSPAHDPDYGINGIKEYKLITPPEHEDLLMLKINPFQLSAPNRRQTRDQYKKTKNKPTQIGIPVLVLLKPLDREELPWVNLTLLAIDGSPPYHTGILAIHIKVSDDNDHSPIFVFQKYIAQLPETTPIGSTVLLQPISISRQSDDNGIVGPLVDHFQAEDPDEGLNAKILYSFARSTPLETQQTFNIDSHTGQLRIARPLSYDDGPISWNFQVVASDNGRPPRSSFTDVLIQLKDSNNHPPSIMVQSTGSKKSENNEDSKSPMTTVKIRENVKLDNKHIATVTVTDRDTGEGGQFECSLRSEDAQYFSLVLKGQLPQVMIYDLLVSGMFDREAGKVRLVGIFCEDKGSSRLSSTHQIRIIIEDENDSDPVFEFPFYRLGTKEGQPKGSIVGQVKASDEDDGESAKLSYEIIWPKGSRVEDRVLNIDREGNFISKVALDRESAPYGYNFTVICRDNGIPRRSASTEVHLALLDVNDCIPVFSQPVYNFTLTEDFGTSFQGQRLVGRVHSTDCDGPEFNRISYSLQNSYHQFSIDNEGRIFTTRTLDREQESAYELLVLAIDGPMTNENIADRSFSSEERHVRTRYNTATATANVIVSDLNDNPPHFVHPSNTSSKGTHTLRIEAKDGGVRPQISHTDVVIFVDASAPVGLHNDFLLGLGPNDGPVGDFGDNVNGLGLGLLGTETMVIVYIVVGVTFLILSFLIAAFIFCRRVKSRHGRYPRHLHRGGHPRHYQGNGTKMNGFVEVNENTVENYHKPLNGYKSANNDCCDGNGETFKTRGSARNDYHQIPSHLTESSCYTIRMASMPRPRPPAGDVIDTTSSTPAAFAYIIPSTRASANVANSVAGGEGNYYLLPQSPGSSTEQSVIGQPVNTCMNQYVGCSGTLGKAHTGTELITIPLSNDTLVRSEIWANDSKSSEAYVTLRPYCQLDTCLQNIRFVDTGVSVEGGSNNLTDSPSTNCLFFQHRQHSSATDSSTPPTTPSISIIDSVIGNRIFVPQFTGNTGGFIIPASNNPSSSSAGIIAVSPESSIKIDTKENTPESTSKPTSSANQGSSGMEVPT
nr:protocadherin 1 [Hymenolepis microstoma]